MLLVLLVVGWPVLIQFNKLWQLMWHKYCTSFPQPAINTFSSDGVIVFLLHLKTNSDGHNFALNNNLSQQ